MINDSKFLTAGLFISGIIVAFILMIFIVVLFIKSLIFGIKATLNKAYISGALLILISVAFLIVTYFMFVGNIGD
ncbi:UNVERIFIED_CONTAM: hypothetical protein O8I53_12135 [Campylobacter lari]